MPRDAEVAGTSVLTRTPAPPRGWAVPAAVFVVSASAFAVPSFVHDNFWLHLMDAGLINALMALGLHVILKTGQISLAHAAFMAIGAFASAQLTLKFQLPFLVGFAAGGLLAGLVAALIGRMILRLRGVYFLLFTFSVGEFLFLFSKQADRLTGGNTGVFGIPAPKLPFIAMPLRARGQFYYLALVVLLLAVMGLWALYRSPFGRAMNAVRENELLAQSTGTDPMQVKLIAFTLGCTIAGLGGSLFAHFARYIAPFSFTFAESVQFLLMNILGGAWLLAGPLIGAAIITALPELLQGYQVWQEVLYGLLLIAIMRFAPDGIAAGLRLLRPS